MHKILIFPIMIFLISCTDSTEKLLLPEEVSPDIYKVLFENKSVKVLKATFEPGQSDKMHDHLPMTAYVNVGGEILITLPDGSINESEMYGY